MALLINSFLINSAEPPFLPAIPPFIRKYYDKQREIDDELVIVSTLSPYQFMIERINNVLKATKFDDKLKAIKFEDK